MKLSDTRPGQCVRVSGFAGGCSDYRQRLLTMGVTPGVDLQVDRLAPWGGCLQVTLRGFQLVLRRAEAASVLVDLVAS